MSAIAIGALFGRRKSRLDPANPTDPVRAHSYDVDDSRANPQRRIGDGSSEFAWAFKSALVHAAQTLQAEHRDPAWSGKHPIHSKYVDVLRAFLSFLDHATGTLTVSYQRMAEKALVSECTAKRAIAAFEFHGLFAHVRRSVKVDAAKGEAGPRRKQATNSYFFDCRRAMAGALWEKFWGRVLYNLKRAGAAAARKAVLLKHTFNDRAKPAPRACGGELGATLARIERKLFGAEGAPPSGASSMVAHYPELQA